MFYILPYYFIYLLFRQKRRKEDKNFERAFVLIIYIAYLISANWFTGLFKEIEWFFLFYIRPVDMIEFLSIVGILLSAILSGYGSTQCILNYLVYPFLKGMDSL
jgi:hypothetical protein